MRETSEPLFKSAIRSFLVTAFGLFGLMAGFIPVMFLLSSAGDTGGAILAKSHYEMESNVDGSREDLRSDSPIILKLDIEGIVGSEFMTAGSIETVLRESQGQIFDEGRVKGIFLMINTPGGTVFDADNIYHQIKRYKERYNVPVIAFVDGLCASGGMYIASAADQIYASEVSLIGSVGVILNTFMNFNKFLTDHGITSQTISAGEGKDAMNPFRPWTEGEDQNLAEITQYYYNQFVTIVTESRHHLDRDKLVNEYGARIFPASVAAEYGFIDGYGYDYPAALNILVEATELEEEKYQVVNVSTRNWWNTLVQGKLNLLRGKVTHNLELAPGLTSELTDQYLYLYRP